MNRDTDRIIFQIAWSEEHSGYVGTAGEFPALSHRSATAQGALAGIQQLVADVLASPGTDEEPLPFDNERHCPVPCLVCGKTMETTPVGQTHPSGGVTIHIFGNYGSKVFDPNDDTHWLGCKPRCVTTVYGPPSPPNVFSTHRARA